MSKKKKISKSKKKPKNTENNSHSEGDVNVEKSCNNCHFSTSGIVNENGYCKRHREYLRTLVYKNIISDTQFFCKLWHVELR